MFASNNNGNNHSHKDPAAGEREALSTLFLIVAGAIAIKFNAIRHFYYQNFEMIWFALWVILLAGIAVAVRRHKKNTGDEFGVRVRALKHLWSPKRAIFAARMLDGSPIYMPDEFRCGHVQIVGTTGRGKTESVILPWLTRDVKQGKSALLIDGKGDPQLVAAARRLSHGEICVFDLGNLENSCTTNPLDHGSAQQITDRLFATFDFDDSFYRGVQYDVAGSVIELLKETEKRVTFRSLYKSLTDDDYLSELIQKSARESVKGKLSRHLAQPAKDRAQLLMGLTAQLGPFAVGEIAPFVNGRVKGKEYQTVAASLLETDQSVFMVLLPTLKYQKLGRQLGKLMLQELAWAVGERASKVGASATFMPVFLDEFSAFAYLGFEAILNKARSSNVALHLSHQSLGDLSLVSPDFARIVNTNTNVKCLLGLNDPDTADFYARHIGTRSAEKITERARKEGFFGGRTSTGEMSIREVESYKVHPNDLKNFTRGRGVLHVPTPSGNATEIVQFARSGEEES